MFKILCLDGGGARGYFTSYMIKRIEEKYNIKAYEYFDLIVGTSTGAIIAGGLGLGLDTEEIFEIYEKESKNIFKKRAFPNNGIIGSMFSNEYLLKLISKKYMNKDFFDLKTNLMITSTDVTRAVPVIIKSWEQNDISLIDAVISSSSAPCYFDPFKLNDTYYSDGCIWANNPALIAFSDAISKDSFNKKEDSKEVYIFPESGRKYHNKSCQCLNPACEKVYITPAIKSRFKQCDICKKKGYKGNQAVFCFFHSGEVYHRGDCPSVDKYYEKIQKREAISRGYSACSICGG